MKIYRVGGAVRDELLGRATADRDYVVVGATPEEMLAQAYRPVGRDFPVFLHPQSGEEYALARTERKSGRGYHGFTFHVAPDVTLEEDLGRRDLTINAMARDADGTLIDPYGGERDLSAGVLRHVSAAFAEDPLRVLRVARFAARLGFAVAPETEALMPLMDSSLLELIASVGGGGSLASSRALNWKPLVAVTTVVAADGYPEKPRTGDLIRLPKAPEGLHVFHAGTALNSSGDLVSSGGRVLAITAVAEGLFEAADRSREYAEEVSLKGKQLRGDIGWRELTRGAGVT